MLKETRNAHLKHNAWTPTPPPPLLYFNPTLNYSRDTWIKKRAGGLYFILFRFVLFCFCVCCYFSSNTLFQLLVVFSPLAQNTALHLAAIHDSPEVVSCLLSYPDQEILLNNKNHNVLDAALNSDRKSVSLAIASHERLVKENHSFDSSIQCSARDKSRALHVINIRLYVISFLNCESTWELCIVFA